MIYAFGEFTLDTDRYQLHHTGKLIKTEPKVFDLLAYLIIHRGRTVSRDELIEQLWPGLVVSEAALTHCVAKARKAVCDTSTRQQLIKTQIGRGYRFIVEATEQPDKVRTQMRGWMHPALPSPATLINRILSLTSMLLFPWRNRGLTWGFVLFLACWATVFSHYPLSPAIPPDAMLSERIPTLYDLSRIEGMFCQQWVSETRNPTARQLLVQGWNAHALSTPQAHTHARYLFQQAITHEPSYAAAFASLGWLAWQNWWSWDQAPYNLEQAARYMQRAIALNDSCPDAYLFLADIYLTQKHHAQSIASAERAIALDYTCARCYGSLAATLAFAGQPQRALNLAEKAIRLDTTAAAFYTATVRHAYQIDTTAAAFYATTAGHAYRLLGQHEKAIAALRRAVSYNPRSLFARANLAAVYTELGRKEDARAELVESFLFPSYSSLDTLKRLIPYKDPAESERLLAILRQASIVEKN